MPSFDVVSKVNLMELDNALHVAIKEIANRFDFRGSNTQLERTPEGLILRSSDEERTKSAVGVLRDRMAKRNVSQRCLDPQPVEAAGGQTVRQLIKIKQGIEIEMAKKMVRLIKDSKIRVQGSIQGDEVRFTGKNRDDLQAAMTELRGEDFGVDLQFVNFRD